MSRLRNTPERAADDIVTDTTEIRTDIVCRYGLHWAVDGAFDAPTARTLEHAAFRASRRYDPIVDAVHDVADDAASGRP